MLLIIIIVFKLLQVLRINHTLSKGGLATINLIILDHPDDCEYQLGGWFLKLTSCHQYQIGSSLKLISKGSNRSDKQSFSFNRLVVQRVDEIKKNGHSVQYPIAMLRRKFTNLSQYLSRGVEGSSQVKNSGFLISLVLGDKSNLLPSQSHLLKIMGMQHVVAVSGFHVSLLVRLVRVVLVTRVNRLSFLTLSSLILVIFAFLTGFRPSVIRASLMMFFSLVSSHFLLRQHSSLVNLTVVAWIMLVVNPWYLFDLSFQLSVMATLSIILWMDLVKSTDKSLFYDLIGVDKNHSFASRSKSASNKVFTRVKEHLITGFQVTLAAQIGIFPLLLKYFGEFNLVGLVTNPVLVWLVPFIFYSGLGLFFLVAFEPFLRIILPLLTQVISLISLMLTGLFFGLGELAVFTEFLNLEYKLKNNWFTLAWYFSWLVCWLYLKSFQKRSRQGRLSVRSD